VTIAYQIPGWGVWADATSGNHPIPGWGVWADIGLAPSLGTAAETITALTEAATGTVGVSPRTVVDFTLKVAQSTGFTLELGN
jgi:hypothetical protein